MLHRLDVFIRGRLTCCIHPASVAGVVAILATILSVDALARLEASQGVVSSNPGPPPPSVEEAFRRADAVIVAAVEGRGQPEVHARGNSKLVLREQRVRVQDVFKGTAQVGDLISVYQAGGTAEQEGREQRTAYEMRLLEPGERLVLFLNRSVQKGKWTIAFGSAGAYWFDARDPSRVTVPNSVRTQVLFAGSAQIPAGRLLAVLANLRDRKAGDGDFSAGGWR